MLLNIIQLPCKTDISQNTMTPKFILFFLLVLRFQYDFRFLILFSNKYLNINRIKIFDLNIAEKQKSVKANLTQFSWSLFDGYFCSHLRGFFWMYLICRHIYVLTFITVFMSIISANFLFDCSEGFWFSIFERHQLRFAKL